MKPREKTAAGKSLTGLVLALTLLLFPGPSGAGAIRVTWDPAKVTPGSVVSVSVESPVQLRGCEALVGPDRFPMIPTGTGLYVALVGIDLEEKEPLIPVDLLLSPLQGGEPRRLRANLAVQGPVEAAPVQSLSLPTGMVDFTPERLAQIRDDRRALEESLGARTPERFWKEGFRMPVEGRITTRFGVRRVLNGQERSPHGGVDIAANSGTPIRVSNGGVVLLAEELYLSGKTIVVDHGWGVATLYGHLEEMPVRAGQDVGPGEVIGTVGTTGRSTGPHLHFGAFVRGVKVDPFGLIEATRGFAGAGETP